MKWIRSEERPGKKAGLQKLPGLWKGLPLQVNRRLNRQQGHNVSQNRPDPQGLNASLSKPGLLQGPKPQEVFSPPEGLRITRLLPGNNTNVLKVKGIPGQGVPLRDLPVKVTETTAVRVLTRLQATSSQNQMSNTGARRADARLR